MVVAEECGDDITRFLPALKLGSYFFGRAWTLAERAVKNSAFFGNVKLAVSFDCARSALADLGQFVVFLQNRDMLEKQRRNGFSTVFRFELGGFFLVPCDLIVMHKAVALVLYHVVVFVTNIVVRINAPNIPCNTLAVGGKNRQIVIAAAVNVLVIHRSSEIIVFAVNADLIFFCKTGAGRLGFGIVIAEYDCKRNILFRNRRNDFLYRFTHIVVCKFLPIAADIVAAENNKVRLCKLHTAADNVNCFGGFVYRNRSVFVVIHFGIDLVNISQMKYTKFSVLAEAERRLPVSDVFM